MLRSNGEPIAGLYAVGNDAASVFGGDYPGGGSTLGPGMTFAYIAGKTIAQEAHAAADTAVASTTAG